MISAFQCHDISFGFKLTDEQLIEVSKEHEGKLYTDTQAAICKKDSAMKKKDAKSPFVLEFEYGCNNEGYWCYENMVCLLEDCTDVLKVLYPQYDFFSLFDHSCGHDKQPEDTLNVENMSKLFG